MKCKNFEIYIFVSFNLTWLADQTQIKSRESIEISSLFCDSSRFNMRAPKADEACQILAHVQQVQASGTPACTRVVKIL